MTTELKPCPFCGAIGRCGPDGAYYFEHSPECWLGQQHGKMLDCVSVGDVEAWNKRRADGLRNFLDAEHKKAFGESKLQAAKAYFAALIQFDKLLGKSMGLQPKNEGK